MEDVGVYIYTLFSSIDILIILFSLFIIEKCIQSSGIALRYYQLRDNIYIILT
jgi:hypothetical protein